MQDLARDVDPRGKNLPVLPRLPVAGATELAGFRSGDSGAESRFPHLDRPV